MQCLSLYRPIDGIAQYSKTNSSTLQAMGNLDFVGYSELSRDFRKSYGTGGDIRFCIETDEQIPSKLLKI